MSAANDYRREGEDPLEYSKGTGIEIKTPNIVIVNNKNGIMNITFSSDAVFDYISDDNAGFLAGPENMTVTDDGYVEYISSGAEISYMYVSTDVARMFIDYAKQRNGKVIDENKKLVDPETDGGKKKRRKTRRAKKMYKK